MKITAILLFAASLLFAGECKQYTLGDNIIRFRCDDGKSFLVWPEVSSSGFISSIMNVSVITRNEDGTQLHEIYTFAEYGHGEECKKKYFYTREVYDEFDIRMERKTTCSSKSEYEPLEVWKKIKRENTMIPVSASSEE